MFTGGEDINPALYNENVGKHTHFNRKRDLYEVALYNMYPDTPKLGVCRGHQLLTVLAGGSLIQHVSQHSNGMHDMILYTGEKLSVTSCHHQMADLSKLQPLEDYFLIGWAHARSTTYLNGDNEEHTCAEYAGQLRNIVHKEPEMVYFPQIKAITVQLHPEWQDGSKVQDYVADWCERLVDGECESFLGRQFDKKTTLEDYYDEIYGYN